MVKNKNSNKFCKKAKIWYNSFETCCKIMKINLKHFILFLIVIPVAVAYNVTAKEFKEGQLYHTSLGFPQLATQKSSIEISKTKQETTKNSLNSNVRKLKSFRQKKEFLNNAEKDSDKKKRKTKIKSTFLKQKKDVRKIKRRKKVDFKDKNGDGYDDRHKANDL